MYHFSNFFSLELFKNKMIHFPLLRQVRTHKYITNTQKYSFLLFPLLHLIDFVEYVQINFSTPSLKNYKAATQGATSHYTGNYK